MAPRRLRPDGSTGPLGATGRLLAFVLVAGLAGVVAAAMVLPLAAGAGVLTRNAVDSFESLPTNLDTPDLPERSVIQAADGSVLATIYYQNRIEVPLDAVAPVMRQAIVAIEDERFLEHSGVDLRGTVRGGRGRAPRRPHSRPSPPGPAGRKPTAVDLADRPRHSPGRCGSTADPSCAPRRAVAVRGPVDPG